MKRVFALSLTLLALGANAAPAGDSEAEHTKRCAADAEICIRDMAAAFKKKGWVGIEWEEIDGRPQISHVVEGSPAEAAGIRVGDLVLAFNGLSTDTEDEVLWAEMKRALVPGRTVVISLERDRVAREARVALVPVPEHIVAQWVGMHMLQHHAAPSDTAAERSP